MCCCPGKLTAFLVPFYSTHTSTQTQNTELTVWCKSHLPARKQGLSGEFHVLLCSSNVHGELGLLVKLPKIPDQWLCTLAGRGDPMEIIFYYTLMCASPCTIRIP